MFRWEYAISEILAHSQGEADLQAIYVRLDKNFPLEDSDRRATKWGGRPAYQHVTRSVISNMRKAGDTAWVSRGRYRLTDQGRARFAREGESYA
ncbi:MAG: hypothetical protein WD904_07440 [Dehalococcoidia bacterium]